MRIEILHLQNTDSELDIRMLLSPEREEAIRLLRSGKYERVAVIDTEVARDQYLMGDSLHLDIAWQATNNIDPAVPWYTQPCVEERLRPWARSSMVGDIFVAGDIPYLVKGMGFECLVPERELV